MPFYATNCSAHLLVTDLLSGRTSGFDTVLARQFAFRSSRIPFVGVSCPRRPPTQFGVGNSSLTPRAAEISCWPFTSGQLVGPSMSSIPRSRPVQHVYIIRRREATHHAAVWRRRSCHRLQPTSSQPRMRDDVGLASFGGCDATGISYGSTAARPHSIRYDNAYRARLKSDGRVRPVLSSGCRMRPKN